MKFTFEKEVVKKVKKTFKIELEKNEKSVDIILTDENGIQFYIAGLMSDGRLGLYNSIGFKDFIKTECMGSIVTYII